MERRRGGRRREGKGGEGEKERGEGRWMKRRNCVREELRRTMGIAIRDRETGYRSQMGLRMEMAEVQLC